MLEKILNKFGYYKKGNKRPYNEIKYLNIGSPAEESPRYLEFIGIGNSWIQNKTTEEYEFMGHFLTFVLLIEYKLSQLLIDFDPVIETKMFGTKLDVYKDFLKAYKPQIDENINDYRNLISPLKDIKKLRDAMAHDITKSKFTYKDIVHIENYVRKMRPDLLNELNDYRADYTNCIGVIFIFTIVFELEISKLRASIL